MSTEHPTPPHPHPLYFLGDLVVIVEGPDGVTDDEKAEVVGRVGTVTAYDSPAVGDIARVLVADEGLGRGWYYDIAKLRPTTSEDLAKLLAGDPPAVLWHEPDNLEPLPLSSEGVGDDVTIGVDVGPDELVTYVLANFPEEATDIACRIMRQA